MKKQAAFVLKGNLLYCKDADQIISAPNSYLVCEEGKVAGVFDTLPDHYTGIPVTDYGDKLIIPGLVDLHLHAPQYSFRGLGMDLELLDWLNINTFPEESKYADLDYARKAYQMFADAMAAGATTRACVFATIHVPGTMLLMELLDKTGIHAMVGKVNMDRNSPDILRETSAQSLADTEQWLAACEGRYENITPILTPRFIPSCTDELMKGLASLQKKTGLPMQSHLSENLSEIAWVKELCPYSSSYGDAYDQLGMFGGDCPTVMAHCVHLTEEEIELAKKRGVFIAHCAQSNTNLASGVAPMRTYLDHKMNVGLGTDVAGGFSPSIFRAMSDAVQASKLRWRLLDNSLKPLTMPEAFYLATKGGGAFFGKVGSFEEGYEFDAVVIDDSSLVHPQELTPQERLERVIYLSDERNVSEKYIGGVHISK
ncbi:amidohydrolase family protein [Oscillospiraceae bacterium PP1C4]